jgi:hypothetical protein
MDFTKLRKLGQPVAPAQKAAPGTRVTGIVKVKKDGYQPAKMRIRANIGDRIFTADFLSDDLAEIESDPQIEAVSLAETLPLQKLP